MNKPAASERAKNAMKLAQEIAEERGDTEVTTAHILVALMRDPNSHARVVLEDYMGKLIDPEALKDLMWSFLQERPKEALIPFDSLVKKVAEKQIELGFETPEDVGSEVGSADNE